MRILLIWKSEINNLVLVIYYKILNFRRFKYGSKPIRIKKKFVKKTPN